MENRILRIWDGVIGSWSFCTAMWSLGQLITLDLDLASVAPLSRLWDTGRSDRLPFIRVAGFSS
jgi:hypothetical protein